MTQDASVCTNVFSAGVSLRRAICVAQATIAGAVKDSSGAVLPGVTVEAASPALIEKVRTTATDGADGYRIEDLRPGAYVVTFTLPGFVTVRRDGVIVSGTGVINVDSELRVGGVQETVTVTGETPIVDIQSTKREVSARQRNDARAAERPQLQLSVRRPFPACRPTSTTSTAARCSRSSRFTAAAASSRASPSRG